MKPPHKLNIIFLIASILFANPAIAEAPVSLENMLVTSKDSSTTEQCKEIVKQCFVSDINEMSKCFFTSAKHDFCDGTDLGSLVFKRWAMSPHKVNGIQAPSALLGPQLVNQDCLRDFENMLSVTLQQENVSSSGIANLSEKLDSCSQEISDQLARP